MDIQALLSRAAETWQSVQLLRFARAHRVRHERGKRLAAEAFGRNRLLRVVEPLAIRVLRTHQNRARRARRRDAMPGDGAVHGEHVAVIAQHLEIVGGPVARREPFVVQHRALFVRGHRQVAAETVGRPRRVAGVAGHAAVGVRELRFVFRHVAPRHAVGAQRFRQARFLVVVRDCPA